MNTWIKETEYQKQKEFSESKPNWSPRRNHSRQRRRYCFVEPTQYEVQCGTARSKDESHRHGNDLHYRSQYTEYEPVLCSRARLSADHSTRKLLQKSTNLLMVRTPHTKWLQLVLGTYSQEEIQVKSCVTWRQEMVERNRTGQSHEKLNSYCLAPRCRVGHKRMRKWKQSLNVRHGKR